MNAKLPAHFYMAPSSANRWIRCPGSLRATVNVEDEGGEAASIGTLGHVLAEVDLRGEPLDPSDREFLESIPDDVREWLEEAVEICVNHVEELAGIKFFETKIQHELIGEHGGTIDVIVYDSPTDTLHVIDFKFGRVKVDAEDNKQIQCYLNLARQMFPKAKRFLGSIIQPRISKEMQTCEFTRDQLDQHEKDVIEASISERFEAGDHCKWCPILSSCETAAKHLRDQCEEFPDLVQFVGEISGKPTKDQVETLTRIYKTFKLAEKATEGAGNILKRWAREGADIGSHGLGLRVSARANWNDHAKELLENEVGDPYREPQLMTPTEVRKLLGFTKAEFEEKFKEAITFKEITTLTMGRGVNDFPEFPDE